MLPRPAIAVVPTATPTKSLRVIADEERGGGVIVWISAA